MISGSPQLAKGRSAWCICQLCSGLKHAPATVPAPLIECGGPRGRMEDEETSLMPQNHRRGPERLRPSSHGPPACPARVARFICAPPVTAPGLAAGSCAADVDAAHRPPIEKAWPPWPLGNHLLPAPPFVQCLVCAAPRAAAAAGGRLCAADHCDGRWAGLLLNLLAAGCCSPCLLFHRQAMQY